MIKYIINNAVIVSEHIHDDLCVSSCFFFVDVELSLDCFCECIQCDKWHTISPCLIELY